MFAKEKLRNNVTLLKNNCDNEYNALSRHIISRISDGKENNGICKCLTLLPYQK